MKSENQLKVNNKGAEGISNCKFISKPINEWIKTDKKISFDKFSKFEQLKI